MCPDRQAPAAPADAPRPQTAPPPQVAVGAVCVHGGRLLVVQRANDPGAGRWSLPGGRVEPGEPLVDALVREVAEEAGLQVRVGALCGIAERIGAGHHFVILDFWAAPDVPSGADAPAPVPGDDSRAARWVTRADLRTLPVVDHLAAWLDEHGVTGRLR